MVKRQGEAVLRSQVTVYGSPQYLANLLDSTAALVDREPAQTFVDEAGSTSALRLAALLVGRVEEARRGEARVRPQLRMGRVGVTGRARGRVSSYSRGVRR